MDMWRGSIAVPKKLLWAFAAFFALDGVSHSAGVIASSVLVIAVALWVQRRAYKALKPGRSSKPA